MAFAFAFCCYHDFFPNIHFDYCFRDLYKYMLNMNNLSNIVQTLNSYLALVYNDYYENLVLVYHVAYNYSLKKLNQFLLLFLFYLEHRYCIEQKMPIAFPI